jgi:hypothetical protein
MTLTRCLLYAYRVLLRFYPPTFRTRFTPEMLEVAEAAELSEWPLIFGDTGITIVRRWLDPAVLESTAPCAEPDAYLSLGTSPISGFGLLRGFALSLVLILCLSCVTSVRYWTLPPSSPECTPRPAKNPAR